MNRSYSLFFVVSLCLLTASFNYLAGSDESRVADKDNSQAVASNGSTRSSGDEVRARKAENIGSVRKRSDEVSPRRGAVVSNSDDPEIRNEGVIRSDVIRNPSPSNFPQLTTYQGFLTNAAGEPIDLETHKFSCAIFPQQRGGSPDWDWLHHNSVDVTRGWCTVELGTTPGGNWARGSR